ncbi:MAG TPA: hypothetical protein VF230_09700 [Acidimicrobiales bacterium]
MDLVERLESYEVTAVPPRSHLRLVWTAPGDDDRAAPSIDGDVETGRVLPLLASYRDHVRPGGGGELSDPHDTPVVIEIGPVASEAALAWLENTRHVLAAVRDHRASLPFVVPPEVISAFGAYLDDWERTARASPVFLWRGDAPAERVRLLVQYWFNIDSLDRATVDRLGITWSPAEARPFLEALMAGIMSGLAADESTAGFAGNLQRSWRAAIDPYAECPERITPD